MATHTAPNTDAFSYSLDGEEGGMDSIFMLLKYA